MSNTPSTVERPRISVVVPHLNEPANLRLCLEAIHANQLNGTTFEVIVADNGSTVLPHSICGDFPSVRLVVEHRPGPGPARNAGAALARGEIICFIDCDCFVLPDYLQTCSDFFSAHPEMAFFGGSIGIHPSRPPRLNPFEAYEAVFSYRTEMFVRRDKFAATGNMAVRAEVFEAVGPFAGIGLHEDLLWGQRAVAMGYRIAHLPAARVLTPGCGDFAAIKRRIERHVAHDRCQLGPGWPPRARWMITALLMLFSPPAGIKEIMLCEQVGDNSLRWLVFVCLCRVRAYRARLMVEMLHDRSSEARLARWNRPDTSASVEGVK